MEPLQHVLASLSESLGGEPVSWAGLLDKLVGIAVATGAAGVVEGEREGPGLGAGRPGVRPAGGGGA